ncbi:MAG TPA: hypothetical protein VMF65_08920 [Acidimicrobiales bacterium]|nr:hypothetical protein [Acidimicrobiales bacterium]
MSWAWTAPLVVAGLGAVVCAALAGAVRREANRVRPARVEVPPSRRRLRRPPN